MKKVVLRDGGESCSGLFIHVVIRGSEVLCGKPDACATATLQWGLKPQSVRSACSQSHCPVSINLLSRNHLVISALLPASNCSGRQLLGFSSHWSHCHTDQAFVPHWNTTLEYSLLSTVLPSGICPVFRRGTLAFFTLSASSPALL